MQAWRGLLAGVSIWALVAPLSPSFATATEPIPWEQAKAADLARQLADASRKVYDELYREMESAAQRGGGGGQEYHSMKDRLRLFKSESRHLASELEEGKGRDETLPVMERLVELLGDMGVTAKRIYMQQPLEEKIVTARAAIDQLAPYYGVELPAPAVTAPPAPVFLE